MSNDAAYVTMLGSDLCGVKANWAEASSAIKSLDMDGNWDVTQYQVADFGHSEHAALRQIMTEILQGGGDAQDEEALAEMEAALAKADWQDEDEDDAEE